MGPFNYTCQCVPGYTGLACEAEIDECLTAVCPANSVCVDSVNSYSCVCLPGFEGEECTPLEQREQIKPCDEAKLITFFSVHFFIYMYSHKLSNDRRVGSKKCYVYNHCGSSYWSSDCDLVDYHPNCYCLSVSHS